MISEQNTGRENREIIQDALDNSGFFCVPNGAYPIQSDILLGEVITLRDNNRLWLDSGATLLGEIDAGASATHSHPVILVNGDNTRISGQGKITGTMASNHYGLLINESISRARVEGVQIENFGGDGIVTLADDVEIKGVSVFATGRNGISVTAGSFIKIESCIIKDAGLLYDPQSGIIIEPNSGISISDVFLIRNMIDSCRIGIYAQAGHGATERVLIDGNTVKNVSYLSINAYRISDSFVKDNRVDGLVYVTECANTRLEQSW